MHPPKHALPRTGVGELSEESATSAVDNTTAASSRPEDESSVPDWDFPVWKILGAAWVGANEPFSATQGSQGQSQPPLQSQVSVLSSRSTGPAHCSTQTKPGNAVQQLRPPLPPPMEVSGACSPLLLLRRPHGERPTQDTRSAYPVFSPSFPCSVPHAALRQAHKSPKVHRHTNLQVKSPSAWIFPSEAGHSLCEQHRSPRFRGHEFRESSD